MVKHILFDWGDTLMVDKPEYSGPMYQWPNIALCDGAANALATLSRNYACHVATNAKDSSEQEIWNAFKRCELDRFISKVFCFDSLKLRKPDPEYFESIREMLACRKDELLMVGDSWEKDIAGALAAGIDAVWLSSQESRNSNPQVRRVASLADLVSLMSESA